MGNKRINIREAKPEEFAIIGKLMVDVYAQLDGFPKKDEQPDYYKTLANVGEFTLKPKVKLFIAISYHDSVDGAVLYFGDMKYYGSGGAAIAEKNAAGFRLLAVNADARGQGIGKLLTKYCINLAKNEGQEQLVIHSTKAMEIAWKMYENLGFNQSEDLDFKQGTLQVYGFRLLLSS